MFPRDLISWKPSKTERPREAEAAEESREASSSLEPMDRFFKDFFHDFRLEPADAFDEERAGARAARVAVTEDRRQFKLVAEVPGMSAADIEVKLSGDVLVLGGCRESETQEAASGGERSYRSFYRSLKLPPGISKDEVHARVRDGVLTLNLPKEA